MFKEDQILPLARKVALVTGASRGVGRGVALALAAAGATVYVTGRTVALGSHALPGTVGQTAAECNEAGGEGIAVAVDHGNDAQVANLFARIKDERGRLDILVNNAFSLPETLTEPGAFWEKPLDYCDMLEVGVRSNYVAAWQAARIMVPQRSGLIVATSGYAGRVYNYAALFGVCKSAVDRMAHDMAIELMPHHVTSLSLWLGLTFTERADRNLGAYPSMAQSPVTQRQNGTSIHLPGRVIAALASDQCLIQRTGGTLIAVELAREYGITDVDGKLAPSLREVRGAPIWDPVW